MEIFNQIKIPEEDRFLKCLETPFDEIRHDLLLKFYRQYLDDNGVMYKYAIENLRNTGFDFLIADGPTYFITSDSPSFVFKRTDGMLQGIMPITPHILLSQRKCMDASDMYYISHIKDNEVQKYNTIIKENATEFIIIK